MLYNKYGRSKNKKTHEIEIKLNKNLFKKKKKEE